MQEEGLTLSKSEDICLRVREEEFLEVSEKLVREVMRKDLRLSFVKTKKLNTQANSDKSLVLRQQYALKMMRLLSLKTRVINIDETWINETSFIRKTWSERDGRGNT